MAISQGEQDQLYPRPAPGRQATSFQLLCLKLRRATSHYRWVVCGLLFCATTINYMDRQVLSLLKPILDQQFGWTSTEFGAINSSFQAAYGASGLAFGWLIDRYGTKIGYAVSITVWSAAAMAHALVASIPGFFVARIALGLGEAGNFPAGVKAGRAMVSQAGTRLRDQSVHRGFECWRHHRAGHRAARRVHAGLALGVHLYRFGRADLARVLVVAFRPPRAVQTCIGERTGADPGGCSRPRRRRRPRPLADVTALSPDLVGDRRPIPDRPGLVVLPDLAA